MLVCHAQGNHADSFAKGQNDALKVHSTESLSQYSLGNKFVVAARLPASSAPSVIIQSFSPTDVR